MTKVTERDWEHACHFEQGWCVRCQTFSGVDIHPDAQLLRCSRCLRKCLYGLDYALLFELFEIAYEYDREPKGPRA